MLKKIVRKVFANKTLYYSGCVTKNVATDIDENYKLILKKLGVDFITIDDMACAGNPVLNAGYLDEFEKLKEKNSELLDKFGISKIITSCPGSLKVFKQNYKLKEQGIEVVHIYEFIASKIEKVHDKFKKGGAPRVTFHDSCSLGRYCGIYDGPRKLILAAGYGLEEFARKREKADCCGACGGVKANFPQVANDIAKQRLKQCKTQILVTASPSCYLHLKQNATDVQVVELSDLIKDAIA